MNISGEDIGLAVGLFTILGVLVSSVKFVVTMREQIKTLFKKIEEIQADKDADVKELKDAKKELGSYGYAAQRQQEPVPRGGGIVKEHWFKYYQLAPERFDLITLSIDCTFKDLETSDYVVLQAWGINGRECYLLDQYRKKMGFVETIKQ